MSCNSLSSLESDHSVHDKTFLRQSDFPATMDFWNKKLILNILQIHATWKARGPWAKLLTWGTMFIHLWWRWALVVSSLLSLGIQSGSNLKFKQTIYISYHLMCYYIYNIFYASFIICYYGYWQQLCNSFQNFCWHMRRGKVPCIQKHDCIIKEYKSHIKKAFTIL